MSLEAEMMTAALKPVPSGEDCSKDEQRNYSRIAGTWLWLMDVMMRQGLYFFPVKADPVDDILQA